ncbi:MAG: dTDP-3-amino-3,4,6-trideoxy-alpha-D-glucopyranose [Syntrophorhabdus sp. PtaB.Bin027]|nr:MAG: dTDP-3-amino-3,4,6-trideoxy-alpha-D-glucopyranose [Syntrophorhabdus sp. PtaB.Bin027]
MKKEKKKIKIIEGIEKEAGIFNDYALIYDILYQDKNYKKESRFVSELIKQYSLKSPKELKIIDLACGTGQHIIELSKLGYKVEGSDPSEEMIKIAKQKNKETNLNIEYYNESFQTSERIKKKYDVILLLFSSINYLIKYEDITTSLKNFTSLLNEGGILIFDFWNGNAVIRDYFPLKVKRAYKRKKQVIRISETTLDLISQVSNVKFHFIVVDDGIIVNEFDEEHQIRYFFLQEMQDLLQSHGFKVIGSCPFLENSKPVSAYDWNVTFIAKKC